MALGGLGQSTQPVNWFERRQSPDFIFARSYDAYTARTDNVPFYNGKTPLSNLMYIESGQKRYREEHFELVHSQNVSPSTSANISYKARSTMGKYEWQRTKNHALSVAFAHTGKRYSVHAAYMNNMIDTRENGGVVGEWGHSRHHLRDAVRRAYAADQLRGAQQVSQQRLLQSSRHTPYRCNA